jgi:hypothetical protein
MLVTSHRGGCTHPCLCLFCRFLRERGILMLSLTVRGARGYPPALFFGDLAEGVIPFVHRPLCGFWPVARATP